MRNSGILTCFSYFSAIRNPVADGTLSRDALAKMGKNEKVSPDVAYPQKYKLCRSDCIPAFCFILYGMVFNCFYGAELVLQRQTAAVRCIDMAYTGRNHGEFL